MSKLKPFKNGHVAECVNSTGKGYSFGSRSDEIRIFESKDKFISLQKKDIDWLQRMIEIIKGFEA